MEGVALEGMTIGGYDHWRVWLKPIEGMANGGYDQ